MSKKLIEYAKNGDLRGVQKCINKGDLINHNSYSGTALMLASRYGHLEIVKYLVENGALINATNFEGKTALMMSSEEGTLEVVKYLVEHGADVNAKDNEGNTALKFASGNGYIEIVEYLRSKGAKE